MDTKITIRILYEIYNLLLEEERKHRTEDYPVYDLEKIIDKVKNHLDYFIDVEPGG